MISRRLFVLAALVALSAAFVRRQAEETSEDGEITSVGGWDPTIRDRTSDCNELAEDSNDDKYCKVFQRCCAIYFDPMNGDKCQTKTEVCQSRENAVCVYRNCTEMITTTTTTTTAPPTEETSATGFYTVPLTILSLYILH